jgi:hypothetical protein
MIFREIGPFNNGSIRVLDREGNERKKHNRN